jgi:hypothetical protein
MPTLAGALTARKRDKLLLAFVLLLGLALRAAVALAGTNIDHPTELFQYVEQGHRLAFGSGVVPWEYDYGIRSWLLPTLIAGVMKVVGWFTSNPLVYIHTLRLIAALLSLTVIVFAFRSTLSTLGPLWATLTSFFCAIWYHAIILSPSLLTEVLASYLMFPAISLANKGTDEHGRVPVLLGILLGVTFCLRFQMAPALAVIAGWHCRSEFRKKWLPMSLAAAAATALLSGALDYATLGSPFQSIWLNFKLNALEGVSSSFGHQRTFKYLEFLTGWETDVAFPFVGLLLWLVFLGSWRTPLLAITAAVVVISHSLFGHKEYRFIAFSLLSVPILFGVGLGTFAEILERRVGAKTSATMTALLACIVPIASWFGWSYKPPVQPTRNTGILRSVLAAREYRDLCGLGVADFIWTLSGGYTYLHRDVPIYYSEFPVVDRNRALLVAEPALQTLRTNDGRIPLEMHASLHGRRIDPLPGKALLGNTQRFNYLVAKQGHVVSGYTALRCFTNEQGSLWPTACLLHRQGGCAEH